MGYHDFLPKTGENEYEFLWRIGTAKRAGVYQGSWKDIADIMNSHYRDQDDPYRGESAYRKIFSSVYDFYEAGVFNKFSEEEYLHELDSQKRELERMKIQYRDERNAWQKQNYTDARVSHVLDKLADELKSSGRIQFNDIKTQRVCSNNDVVVLLSDLHIGECFDNFYGTYNSQVAKDRLNKLLLSVFDIMTQNDSMNCHVFLLGDCISGSFRRSIQVTNRENVVDQIKITSELVSSFCYELTTRFKNVTLTSVAGNHSRLSLKSDDDIKDERLDDLVAWAVGLKLGHINNFLMPKSNIDNSLAISRIRDKMFVLVHGDNGDPTSDSVMVRIMSTIGFKPYAICCGHLHTNSFTDVSGVKVIRSGSLCGSGNQFTRAHNYSGSPEQMVMVVDDFGIRSLHPIVLD